jgi:CRISPR type II-A-associated protein Csn2
MILTHTLFERPLISDGFGGDLLILENPSLMFRLLKEILAQLEGEEGSCVLVEDGKSAPIEKTLHLLLSPLALEHNPRKALTALYKQLDESLISAEAAQKLDELLTQMRECLQEAVPESYAELDELVLPEWDATLKFFEISFRTEFHSLVDELNEYFKMMKHYCGIKGFICSNLLSFISVTDLARLFAEAAYNEYNILAVEPRWEEGQAPVGKQLIIMDQDQCEL